jgi:hypothetical protein
VEIRDERGVDNSAVVEAKRSGLFRCREARYSAFVRFALIAIGGFCSIYCSGVLACKFKFLEQ